MQVSIELNPAQLAKANNLATKDGTNLSGIFQYLIDKADIAIDSPIPAWRVRIKAEQASAEAKKQAILAFHSLPPEERKRLNAPYIAQLDVAIEAAKAFTPEQLAEGAAADLKFMLEMNESCINRGAVPWYDIK